MYGRLHNAPHKDIHVLMPGTCECYQIWQGLCQCDKLKDLEMEKLSYIIWMKPT